MSHFLASLQRHDGGALLADLDEKLSEVVAAIKERGGKGSVTLKINLEPNGTGFALSAETSTTVPKVKHGQAFVFSTAENELTRQPPADELPRTMGIKGVE